MSRSYKKNPSVKCEHSCKWGKKQANRKFRHTTDDISNGNYYRKVYCTWDVCDYKYVAFSKEERKRFRKYARK